METECHLAFRIIRLALRTLAVFTFTTLAAVAQDDDPTLAELTWLNAQYQGMRQATEGNFKRDLAAAISQGSSARSIAFLHYQRLLDRMTCVFERKLPMPGCDLGLPPELCLKVKSWYTEIMFKFARFDEEISDICLARSQTTSRYLPFDFLNAPWGGRLSAYDAEAYVRCLQSRI